MLSNAFSYLPVDLGKGDWKLLPVYGIVQFVSKASKTDGVKELLAKQIDDAMRDGLKLVEPRDLCSPDTRISDMINKIDEVPILVVDMKSANRNLLGIITSFDLLSYSSGPQYMSKPTK
jgi:CBS domain-containing protein